MSSGEEAARVEPFGDSGPEDDAASEANGSNAGSNAGSGAGDDSAYGDQSENASPFASSAAASPKAPPVKPTLTYQSSMPSAALKVTRTSLLEYMNQRDWWREGQCSLFFTAALWTTFVILMYLRSNAEISFVVKDSLMQHLGDITAHPSLSGVILTSRGEGPTECSCSCRSTTHGLPQDACDEDGSERLDFRGSLPPTAGAQLQDGACEDLLRPVALYGDMFGTSSSQWTCSMWAAYYGGVWTSGCSAQHIVASPNCGEDCQNFFASDPQGMRWRCPATCGYCEERSEADMDVPTIRLDGIQTPADTWFWVEHGMLPAVWGTPTNAPPMGRPTRPVLGRNVIIGGIRARQVRAERQTDCNINNELRQFYHPQCRSQDPATAAYGPAGAYSFAPMSSDPSEAGIYQAVFDVERNASEARALAKFLRENNWLDTATRSFALDALMLNAEANLYALLHINFEFNADGAVVQTTHVRTFQALAGKLAFQDYIPEIAWLIMIIVLVQQELRDLLSHCWHRRCCEYFKNPWQVVDWVSIALGFAVGWYYYAIAMLTTSLSEDIIALPHAPLPPELDVAAYRTEWVAVIESAQHVYMLREYLQLCLFWYTTIITLRFLKGFQGQMKLAMMQKTLSNAFDDVLHFMIVFVTMGTNFALGGRMLFGAEIESWTRFDKAVGASVRMVLGNFDEFDEMYKVAPVNATCWFWLFLLSMVFILMNLFLALLIDHFSASRLMTGYTVPIWTDVRRAWADFKWRCEWRWDNIKDQEYAAAISDPYADIVEGLLEKVEATEEMEVASRHSCLGLRLVRRVKEDASAQPLEGPGNEEVTAMELRQMGCDPMTAEHLIEMCDEVNKEEAAVRHQTKLQQVRYFTKLLRRHRIELDQHCAEIESGSTEDLADLQSSLNRLEASIQDALKGFTVLKECKVDSLALVPPMLEFSGTSLRDTYQSKLGEQPARSIKGPGVLPEYHTLRTAGNGSAPPLAIGNGNGDPVMALANSAHQPSNEANGAGSALADRAGNIPALTDGFD